MPARVISTAELGSSPAESVGADETHGADAAEDWLPAVFARSMRALSVVVHSVMGGGDRGR